MYAKKFESYNKEKELSGSGKILHPSGSSLKKNFIFYIFGRPYWPPWIQIRIPGPDPLRLVKGLRCVAGREHAGLLQHHPGDDAQSPAQGEGRQKEVKKKEDSTTHVHSRPWQFWANFFKGQQYILYVCYKQKCSCKLFFVSPQIANFLGVPVRKSANLQGKKLVFLVCL